MWNGTLLPPPRDPVDPKSAAAPPAARLSWRMACMGPRRWPRCPDPDGDRGEVDADAADASKLPACCVVGITMGVGAGRMPAVGAVRGGDGSLLLLLLFEFMPRNDAEGSARDQATVDCKR